MHKLSELDLKEGDTVLFHPTGPIPMEVTGRIDGRPQLFWDGFDLAQWTLKPQPKETQVTVADLNLSVGDRVTDTSSYGTVYTGTVFLCDSEKVRVQWDWTETVSTYYKRNEPNALKKLPKSEPTLADLGLKVGDGVYDTEEQSFGVVDLSNELFIGVVYCGRRASLIKTTQASRLKKLEVPK